MLMRLCIYIFTFGLLAMGFAQAQSETDTAYRQLQGGSVIYVHPSMTSKVNTGEIERVANEVKPNTLKVMVIPTVPKDFIENGKEMRGNYAKWLLESKLRLSNGIVIILTNKGVSAYSDMLPISSFQALGDAAVKQRAGSDFTPCVTYLAREVTSLAKSSPRTTSGSGSQSQPYTSAAKPVSSAGFFIFLFFFGAIIIGIVLVVVISKSVKKNNALKKNRVKVEEYRRKVIEGVSYLDNYADILGDEVNTAGLMEKRQAAAEKLEQATHLSNTAKNAVELTEASELLQSAMVDIDNGKAYIEAATNGTKVAFKPRTEDKKDGPVLDYSDDPEIYQPVKNACFFCSKPGQGDLTPVTMTLDGFKRTVLTCPDDFEVLKRGDEPQVRGKMQDGRMTPWYQVNGYDPNRDYNDRSWGWEMFGMYMLMSSFNPFAYHGYGYSSGMGYGDNWHNQYDSNSQWNQSNNQTDFGGGDFGSTFSQDTSSDFGGGDFDTSSSFDSSSDSGGDFGGGDFGGGDSGGGDSGGGDF